jgi:serine/threonine protein kinase
MAENVEHLGQKFGDYRLLRWLGGGGCGDVYLGEHVHDQTLAAVKLLHARLTGSEELKAFINEARTIRLKHPNIVSLLDFGIGANDIPFLVMEYAPHGTLRTLHPKGSRLPLSTIMNYVIPIASALQYAHDLHLVHRDVKPENMLVGANGEILLSDFGIATVDYSSHTTSEQESMGGTIAYMAPEQFSGKPRAASDQYALAVVVYEWLCGNRPFQGMTAEVALQHSFATPPSLCEQVPGLAREVEQVVLTALAKDPRQRFASVQEFASALGEAGQARRNLALSSASAATRVLTDDGMATRSMLTNGLSEPQSEEVAAPSHPGQSEPAVPVAVTRSLPPAQPERGVISTRVLFSKRKTMTVAGLALVLLLVASTLVYALVSRPGVHSPSVTAQKSPVSIGSTVVAGTESTTMAGKTLTPIPVTTPTTQTSPSSATSQPTTASTAPTTARQPVTIPTTSQSVKAAPPSASKPTPTPTPVPPQTTNYAVDGQNPTTYAVNGQTCANTLSNSHAQRVNFEGITGTLYFRFSVTCHATWALIMFDKPVSQGHGNARVVRTNDGKTFTCNTGGNQAVAPGQTSCYTGMVHDGPTETATAYATFTFPDGHTDTSAGVGPY